MNGSHALVWWLVRLPAFLVVGLAAFGVVRACSSTSTELVIQEWPSPDKRRKVMLWAGDQGALGTGDQAVSMVAGEAKSPKDECRLLDAGHHSFTDARPLEVEWLDDARVVLTYPKEVPARSIGTRCPGVEVMHVLRPSASERDAAPDGVNRARSR